MARQKKTPFQPWLSRQPDGIEKRYIRLGNSQLLHPAMLNLGKAAFKIYVYMLLESGGKVEFELPRAKYKKIVAPATFQKAVEELSEAGFIEVVQRNANIQKPNKYRFSSGWKVKIEADRDSPP